MAKKSSPNLICKNSRAYFDYELLEKYQAGIALEGWEVRAIRAKKAQISQAYIKPLNRELFLIGAQINPFVDIDQNTNKDSMRSRKLLLHKNEINKILGAIQEKGLSCIPLSLEWEKQKVKCNLAIGRGKKLYDKRQTIKERDLTRGAGRKLKL